MDFPRSLINLSAFYNEMSGFVNEGKLVDIIHLKLSRSLSTVSHKKTRKQTEEMQAGRVDHKVYGKQTARWNSKTN